MIIFFYYIRLLIINHSHRQYPTAGGGERGREQLNTPYPYSVLLTLLGLRIQCKGHNPFKSILLVGNQLVLPDTTTVKKFHANNIIYQYNVIRLCKYPLEIITSRYLII